ncbi:MAG: hypothetical protein D6706_10480 [Chloroflexi bacterium]|nr:MAG: hypothetical protein D6706_10480 [Chloroflexota bacterium]
MRRSWLWWLVVCLALTALVACGEDVVLTETAVSRASPPPTSSTTLSATPVTSDSSITPKSEDESAMRYGYTYQQPDGNRLAQGTGRMPTVSPIDVPLRGVPRWVTAVSAQNITWWAVVLQDNTVQLFQVQDGTITELTPPISQIPFPPLLYLKNSQPALAIPPDTAFGLTHPALLPNGLLAYPLPGDGLQVGSQSLELTPLPDGRILQDENGRLLLLTNPTTRYDHAVLGDELEASGIALLKTSPELSIHTQIPIPDPFVIEGVAPIWTDWDGDGTREIIVTLSSLATGAQIVLFDEQGNQLAKGPAIGQGYRWRHQIAVAPFGPNGEMELVDVLTPHIGGVVEFYRWEGEVLTIVAKQAGYTSHVIGSRNLDMAAAGDFDGDGRFELLLPNQSRTELGAIQHTSEGAKVIWRVPLPGKMVTNLATTTTENGRLVIGVGLDNGILRLWPAQ